jgi:hypothetical protein
MSERKVTIKLTSQKDVIEHMTGARTFGELKKELPDVKFSKMRVVERSTKNTLDMDEAVLPGSDFILFLVPEKVKSGKKDKVKEIDVETAGYNDLRSHASVLNKVKNAQIAMNGGTEDLRKAIKAYRESVGAADAEGTAADPLTIIEEARTNINNAIDVIVENAKKGVDAGDYVVKVSVDDLDDELKSIKKALKL